MVTLLTAEIIKCQQYWQRDVTQITGRWKNCFQSGVVGGGGGGRGVRGVSQRGCLHNILPKILDKQIESKTIQKPTNSFGRSLKS